MAIGQKVRVNVNGVMCKGRVTDVNSGEYQLAINMTALGVALPVMVWVAR